MTGSARRIIVFALVGLGAFLLAFGLGRMAGEQEKEPSEHEGHGERAEHASYGLTFGEKPVGLPAGGQTLEFAVRGPDGDQVTEFETVHEKELHLIVAGVEDPRDYRHVHPVMAEDGTWSVGLDLPAGEYQIYADTKPAGADPQVLTARIEVAGTPAESEPLPAAYNRTMVPGTGLEVSLQRDGSHFEFTAEDRGNLHRTIQLEEYLGAGGHLVGIRDQSLDYLHAHAEQAEGNQVGFHVEAQTPGTYVLHLDFQVGGKVHTATFVQSLEVDGPGGGMGEHEGHDMSDTETEGDDHQH